MNWIHALASGWRDRARYLRETGDHAAAKAFDDAADELSADPAPTVPASGCAICGTPAVTGIEYSRGTLKLCGVCYTDFRQSF
jgi:hypothetical protein